MNKANGKKDNEEEEEGRRGETRLRILDEERRRSRGGEG